MNLIRREIKNETLRSFLHYVPYVTLAVMTFPAIMDATATPAAGLIALAAGIFLAWIGRSMFEVAIVVVVLVYVLERFIFSLAFYQERGYHITITITSHNQERRVCICRLKSRTHCRPEKCWKVRTYL